MTSDGECDLVKFSLRDQAALFFSRADLENIAVVILWDASNT